MPGRVFSEFEVESAIQMLRHSAKEALSMLERVAALEYIPKVTDTGDYNFEDHYYKDMIKILEILKSSLNLSQSEARSLFVKIRVHFMKVYGTADRDW